MSRSRRRTPIIGITTADSEKPDKRRALREGEHETAHSRHTVSDPWRMAKDSKKCVGRLVKRLPALMRK